MSHKNARSLPQQSPSQMGARFWFPLLLIAATIVVYLNSFDGVLVLDDQRYIADNPRVHQLWPVWPLLARRRPVVDISLAVNYTLSELNLFSYHAFNLAVHIVAALTLFGIVRRTLMLDQFRERFARIAGGVAFVIVLIWAIHPLQTQAVTYLIQRAESMMGLFYLLTIYCTLRGMTSGRRWPWFVAAIVACAAGMGSKAIMITAPVMILLYDRAFVAPSFGQMLRRRWGLYVGLVATWGVLYASGLVTGVLSASKANATVGFSYKGISPLDYAATQPGVILHYVRLAFWPVGLCLDYDWPVARSVEQIVPPAIVLALLIGATVWALVRKPWLGFLGAWFFIILSPTSSFIPLRDPLFEHRMYLPLAAVVTVAVIGAHVGWRALASTWKLTEPQRRMLAGLLAALVTALLGYGTIDRNRDYHSAVTMWRDVAAKRPYSDRAQYNLGAILLREGRVQEAEVAFRKALELNPRSGRALYNLGKVHALRGDVDTALEQYLKATQADPRLAEAHSDVANILVRRGQPQLAIPHYREAIHANPAYVQAYFNLGNVLLAMGETEEAVDALETAVQLAPNDARVRYALGQAYEKQGNRGAALKEYGRVLELDPSHVGARQAMSPRFHRPGASEQP